MSNMIPLNVDTASPKQVAAALKTTEASLAQMRYRGTGPRFSRFGGQKRGRILYRWSDVHEYLNRNSVDAGNALATACDVPKVEVTDSTVAAIRREVRKRHLMAESETDPLERSWHVGVADGLQHAIVILTQTEVVQ